MRTNIVLDDELVREAAQLTGIRTKRSLVDTALRLLVKTKRRRSILGLKGRVLEQGHVLLHDDADFDAIAKVRPLRTLRG